MLDEVIDYFNENADELAQFYDSIDRKRVHHYTLEVIAAMRKCSPRWAIG